MRVSRVADTVYTFHNGIHRGIVSDGRISTVKVVINGAGQTDDRKVELHTEVAGTSE